MEHTEKKISYTTINTYETLNTLSNDTKNVWIVLHGIGYLSKYFLKYFNTLNPEENYIIAPQAPSKYYLNNKYTHVGASWLTKENTAIETENVLNYLNSVLENEGILPKHNFIIFGFSQGVSIATRWLAFHKIQCHQLVLYAGIIPNELTKEDLKHLEQNNTQVTVIVGTKDEYITVERMQSEKEKIALLFNNKAKLISFEGEHEIKKELISNLIS